MLEGFLCLTKPSKRAFRGAVLLAPASMHGRFCVSWHNFYSILASSLFAYGECVRCPRQAVTCGSYSVSEYTKHLLWLRYLAVNIQDVVYQPVCEIFEDSHYLLILIYLLITVMLNELIQLLYKFHMLNLLCKHLLVMD